MDESTALVPRTGSLDLMINNWDAMVQMSETLLASGFLPVHIKKKEQAIAILMKGAELGVPPMEALSSLYVVNGRVVCMGQLLMSLMQRAGFEFKQHKITDKGATVTGRSPGGQWVSAEFTRKDADDAGLLNDTSKQPWQKYTKDMMFWRAVSRFSKQYAPAITSGVVLAEEVGIPVTVSDSGGEQEIAGDIDIDASGSDIPMLSQEQLAEFLALVPEEQWPLLADFLFEQGNIEANEQGQPSMATMMEPVAADLLQRWEEVQLSFEEYLKKQGEKSITPETYEAFKRDLLNAGYKLAFTPQTEDEAAIQKEKKEEVDALVKKHKLDGPKLKEWLDQTTTTFSGKIAKNQFGKYSYSETSLDILQMILDTADKWLPLAEKAGLQADKKKKQTKKTDKPPAS